MVGSGDGDPDPFDYLTEKSTCQMLIWSFLNYGRMSTFFANKLLVTISLNLIQFQMESKLKDKKYTKK